jgi:hypothetical protein
MRNILIAAILLAVVFMIANLLPPRTQAARGSVPDVRLHDGAFALDR